VHTHTHTHTHIRQRACAYRQTASSNEPSCCVLCPRGSRVTRVGQGSGSTRRVLRGRAGGDGQLRSFARMSIELRERPAPPASAAVKKSSLFAGSATTISPITEVADEGRQRSQDCASSLAEADDEGVTVSLDDESDSVAEMPALRPERRLSMMRRRRSGAHFTLLPAKAQWIELVLASPPLPCLDLTKTHSSCPRCSPAQGDLPSSNPCVREHNHTRFPRLMGHAV
jgi:hypothetical protein